MSAPTIAITGASGFVGGAALRALVADGVAVVASAPRAQERASTHPAVEHRPLDFFDARTFAPFVRGASSVFLLRPPHIGKVEETLNRFVDVAVEHGVSRMVFLSVAGAETRSYLPHAKVEAHLAIHAARGLRVGIVRPTFFAQNLLSAYRTDIVEDDRVAVCAGAGRVAFVDTDDLGAVAARALTDGILDGRLGADAPALTGPAALTFTEVASLLSSALGRSIRYDEVSIPGFFRLRRKRGDGVMQAVIITALHAGLRQGDAAAVTDAVPALLGRPAKSMQTVVARLAPHLSAPRG